MPTSEYAGDRQSGAGSGRLSAREAYDIHIHYIRHENELIHQRAARFIGIQAAMAGVTGLIMQKYVEIMLGKTELIFSPAAVPVYLFIILLGIVGLTSCWAALGSLRAARDAQLRLDEHFRQEFGSYASDIGLPALMGGGSPTASDHGPRFLLYLPIVLSVFWGIVTIVAIWATLNCVPLLAPGSPLPPQKPANTGTATP